VEASGAEPAIRQAFDMIKIDGRICGVGISGKETVALPWDLAIRKAVNVSCSFSSNWTSWERALSLSGERKNQCGSMISGTYPIEEWNKAFGLLRNLEAVKILLVLSRDCLLRLEFICMGGVFMKDQLVLGNGQQYECNQGIAFDAQGKPVQRVPRDTRFIQRIPAGSNRTRRTGGKLSKEPAGRWYRILRWISRRW